MSMKLKHLERAIRSANCLEDLKRMVGPSDEDEDMAVNRVKKLDAMWDRAERSRWGYDPSRWPYPYNEEYQRVSQEQKDYENQYC